MKLSTLANMHVTAQLVAEFADKINVSLRDVLVSVKLLRKFVNSMCPSWMLQFLGSLLKNIRYCRTGWLGFVVVNAKDMAFLRLAVKKWREINSQHPPMPTKIYSSILTSLIREMELWSKISEEVLRVTAECAKNPALGRSPSRQYIFFKKMGVSPDLGVDLEGLLSDRVLEIFNRRFHFVSVKGLSAIISEAQMILRMVIQAFSGMRISEVNLLHYNCIEKREFRGRIQYIIDGRTTKFSGGESKKAKWVTNESGYRAITLAKQIADAIYSFMGVIPDSLGRGRYDFPLFISSGYFGFGGGGRAPSKDANSPGLGELYRFPDLLERISPKIENEDILELEEIDPHRAWRSEEDFSIGKMWHLTTHQFRRSLALYAQRSGLVSLQSLKKQLQHLTEEMSRYYARGSVFARDFVGNNSDHFGIEWQDTQAESAGLSYLKLRKSNEPLFGGHVAWMRRRISPNTTEIVDDREQTMTMFRLGQISYTESLVGGCTRVGECFQPAIRLLNFGCLKDDCKDLICSIPKLERVISAQENFVKKLDPNSVEYRTEMTDLEVLWAARERGRKQLEGNSNE